MTPREPFGRATHAHDRLTTRYMYVNSTRSSHAIEKTTFGDKTYTLALCGRPVEYFPWPMSFEPKKRVCKTCQMVIDWREQMLRRKYRTLQVVGILDVENPWQLPKGAVSVAITHVDHRFQVHFLEVGKVVIPLEWIEHWIEKKPGFFECIYDPTKPELTKPDLEPLPLFDMAGGDE